MRPYWIFLMFWATFLPAQTPDRQIYALTSASGLSSNVLYSSVQDCSGFVWIASADGLNRLDGSSVRIYRNDPADSSSLPANWVISLLVDRSRTLWIGTLGGGLARYLPETETFQTYLPAPEAKGDFRKNGITSLYEDGTGRIWVATNTAGILIFDREKKKFLPLTCSDPRISDILSRQRTGGILEFPHGTFWFATNGGLIRFIEKQNRFVQIPLTDGKNLPGRVNYVKRDSRGKIRISSSAGMFVLDSPDDTQPDLIRFPGPGSSSTELFDFIEKRDGSFWLTGDNLGIVSFFPETGELKREADGSPALKSASAYTLLQDREGALWINTTDRGAFWFYPGRMLPLNPVHTKKLTPWVSEPVTITSVHSRSDSLIWLGSSCGLLRWNKITGQTRQWSKRDGLPDTFIWSVRETRDGSIWAGTSRGLVRLSPESGKIQVFQADPADSTRLQSPVILSLTETSDGILWAGTQQGLHWRDPVTGHFRFIRPETRVPGKLPYGLVISLFEDPAGRLWVGTNGGGMARMNRETGWFDVWSQSSEAGSALSNNSVLFFGMPADGRLTAATSSGGLNFLDPVSGKISFLRKQDGLPSDGVSGVFYDRNGFLWTAAGEGIARLTLSGQSLTGLRVFDSTDGLASGDISFQAAFQDPAGNLYFGGTGGLTWFQPDSIRDSAQFPRLAFTGLKKSNHEVLPDSSLTVKKHLELDYTDTFFSVSFTAVTFDRKEKIRYAYQLENFDREWIETGSKTDISYTNLDPGGYRLLIRSTNREGRWNPVPKVLTITIHPPFWKTIWFRSASGLLILAGLYLAYRFFSERKYRKILAEVERERELLAVREATREQISRDLHDDVATTLSSISLYLKTRKLKSGKMSESDDAFVDRLDHLSDQARGAMEEVVWALSPRHDSLGALVTRMQETAAEACFQAGLHLEFSAEIRDTEEKIGEKIRKNVYLVFKEAVSNSIRHSGAGTISCRIAGSAETLELEISDDGKGFDPEAAYPRSVGGNGLGNIRKRAGILGAELTLRSEPGKGTTLRLQLPGPSPKD